MKGINLELHSKGNLSVESDKLSAGYGYQDVEIGLKISEDGRIWLCLEGECVLRFSPERRSYETAPRIRKTKNRKRRS